MQHGVSQLANLRPKVSHQKAEYTTTWPQVPSQSLEPVKDLLARIKASLYPPLIPPLNPQMRIRITLVINLRPLPRNQSHIRHPLQHTLHILLIREILRVDAHQPVQPIAHLPIVGGHFGCAAQSSTRSLSSYSCPSLVHDIGHGEEHPFAGRAVAGFGFLEESFFDEFADRCDFAGDCAFWFALHGLFYTGSLGGEVFEEGLTERVEARPILICGALLGVGVCDVDPRLEAGAEPLCCQGREAFEKLGDGLGELARRFQSLVRVVELDLFFWCALGSNGVGASNRCEGGRMV